MASARLASGCGRCRPNSRADLRVSLLAACAGLFAAAFLAATLLPAQSEAVLVALVVAGEIPVPLLVAVASVGNIGGSLVNYALGRGIEHFRGRRWFPVSDAALSRAQGWYARGGRWVLLLSWLPVVGDPLTLVAGIMREKLWVFLLLVGIGKAGRYALLAWMAAG
ncbi:inner membrane protein YqaA [Acetobacteraceae bacterium AT-5844]|nr:inner membrane protein YqaA [Acetobacteraceae bacterium AT-5844]